MIAGLPKLRYLIVSLVVLFAAGVLPALAQDVQTLSVVIDPIIEVQTPSTPLEQIIELVDDSAASAEQKEAVVAAFTTVLEAALLEPDAVVQQAAELLALLNWATLTDPEALETRVTTLQSVLAEYLADPTLDPLVALAEALTAALAPPGTLNALSKAGVEPEALARVAELVESGMPPGIIIRVIKDALRDGATEAEILDVLVALEAAAAGGPPWGQVANEVTGQGEFKHRDEEQNQNEGQNEEPEEEANEHGSQGSNGKALGKDKDKKS